ncbi:MAG TPA: PP2C family protein-serine/threonine phosphatase [Thermoleophilaceae bacterium]|nr:PP2C family protein-serine/threonine phosphatase [Thermoleophilaceae bacterium]
MKLAIAALGLLSLLLAAAYAASALRARSLARQRGELLGEIGLLQRALLPAIPDDLGALRASVAYRPADGPAAGGDFYDVLRLPGERVGFVIGDVSGHGREALERTAFMRYTLRAYLEAGLQPRTALQVAGRVIGDGLGGDFATVLLAVHDARDGSLTYAGAGHPAPIVVHGAAFDPVVAGSSPPIGIGERTGLRQTTVPLPPGTLACLYTDGLAEARTGDGLLGRERLERLVDELGPGATASELLQRVSDEAVLVPDDMAACLLAPTASVTSGGFRTEQLEVSAEEVAGPLPERFLAECGVPADARARVLDESARTSRRFGGAVLSVVFGSRRAVEVLPRNVESIEAASLSTHATGPLRATAAV